MDENKVGSSYHANSPEAQRQTYDDWANQYERDLCAMGYRLPAVAAAVFTRFAAVDSGPILDAGCGGGIQTEPLVLAGYGPFIGIDFSEGMLSVARDKGIYEQLHCMALGEPLDFADGQFATVYCIGTLTPGHAPAESFDELLRVTRSGGLIVFSLRNDSAQEPEFPAAVKQHTEAAHWENLYSTPGFQSMPYGEPHITHQIHVYRKR